MTEIVESLERRSLLSATADQTNADLQTLVGDAQSIFVNLFDFRAGIVADGKAVGRDLHGLHQPQNRKLVAGFHAAQTRWLRTLMHDYHGLLRAGSRDAHRAIKEGNALSLNPGDTIAAGKLLANLQSLQQRTSAPLATFLADMPIITSGLTGSLTTLAAANPNVSSLQTDTSTEITDINNCLTAVQSGATTLQADVATVVGDLS